MSLPRETDTHPTLHEDEAADLITILCSEADRVAKAITDAWGADRVQDVERQTMWLIRIQLLLTAFGRSDLARKYSVAGTYVAGVVKAFPQEKA